MKSVKLLILAGAVSVFALACGGGHSSTNTASNGPAKPDQPQATPTPDELAGAKKFYANSCAVCHGDDGEGGLKEYEGKKMKVPSFKKGHALEHTDAQFAKQISKGGDGMPGYKDKQSEAEIMNLVKLVRRDYQAGLTQPAMSSQDMPGMKH